ncbi:MAG: hypothetical protein BGO25_03330 [Acidobacteriales bacterium 59-55]|nr:hypothetical protein [Terriglobales bacterium]OJV40192.1 MAG: hypothetical protein BGO25_03330 [Acidobacteriales bacterium 59-55]
MRTKYFILTAALALSAVTLLAQETQTISGTVTDAMCGAHHTMMKNATPAECTRACVKQGAEFALASGDKVYTLKSDKAQFDRFAGQNATVKGKVSGDAISVDSISRAK